MAEIILAGGHIALVDPVDFDRFGALRWYRSAGYAARKPRRGAGSFFLLHRLILDAPDDLEVDHINGIPLDNRRVNLRLCTRSGNRRNVRPRRNGTSQYKGVARTRWGWQATICSEYLGLFQEEIEAARAYDAAALERFGAFARINFP